MNDAPPDAQNLTASRKSCEVPSFPSFPQHALEPIGLWDNTSSGGNGPAITYIKCLVVRAPAGRSLLAPGILQTRRISQTAPAYSGTVLLRLICCAPEQTTDTNKLYWSGQRPSRIGLDYSRATRAE